MTTGQECPYTPLSGVVDVRDLLIRSSSSILRGSLFCTASELDHGLVLIALRRDLQLGRPR
jgi:hypothetical protein